ncbi:hypothetical protein PGTUg99_033443 [Puccinia graminis f. sp. tritici]|uniref:Uncharacterized protein n=1 Tax=Puccinia graminis f. sp. tritici TaxID=56615 RepID=A0A5B0RL88_PUCGR|nr:hypothetical protein PGTUg99_033443 [Puccinia graminis f. sp. tritici]
MKLGVQFYPIFILEWAALPITASLPLAKDINMAAPSHPKYRLPDLNESLQDDEQLTDQASCFLDTRPSPVQIPSTHLGSEHGQASSQFSASTIQAEAINMSIRSFQAGFLEHRPPSTPVPEGTQAGSKEKAVLSEPWKYHPAAEAPSMKRLKRLDGKQTTGSREEPKKALRMLLPKPDFGAKEAPVFSRFPATIQTYPIPSTSSNFFQSAPLKRKTNLNPEVDQAQHSSFIQEKLEGNISGSEAKRLKQPRILPEKKKVYHPRKIAPEATSSKSKRLQSNVDGQTKRKRGRPKKQASALDDSDQIAVEKQKRIRGDDELFDLHDWNFIRETGQSELEKNEAVHINPQTGFPKGSQPNRVLQTLRDAISFQFKPGEFYIPLNHENQFFSKWRTWIRNEFVFPKRYSDHFIRKGLFWTMYDKINSQVKFDGYPIYSNGIIGLVSSNIERFSQISRNPLPRERIEVIISIVGESTKAATLLILVYLSIFREIKGGIVRSDTIEEILTTLAEVWRSIGDENPWKFIQEFEWASGLIELLSTGKTYDNSTYKGSSAKVMNYRVAWDLVEYWTKRTTRVGKDGVTKKKRYFSRHVMELINKMVFYLNHDTIIKRVEVYKQRREKKLASGLS